MRGKFRGQDLNCDISPKTRIARTLVSGEIRDAATISLDADGDQLLITWRNHEVEAEAPREPVGAGT